MKYLDPEKYQDLSIDYPNVISNEKIHVLPHCIQSHAICEIYLTKKKSVIIESQNAPIRFGRHCGTRIHLGAHYGNIDYTPKLIWGNGEWYLSTFGTFLFAEMEINTREVKGYE